MSRFPPIAASAAACLLLAGVAGLAWRIGEIGKRPAEPPAPLQIQPAPAAKPAQPTATTEPADQTQPVSSPDIRVNLTPAPVRELQLQIDGPFRIQPVGAAQVASAGRRLEAGPVTAGADGFRVGGKTYPHAHLEIVAENPPAVWIGAHQYRGRIRLHRQDGNRLIAVNVLPLDEYLAGVVDSEMPAAFPPAAREAQAVAARTYALYQMQENRGHPLFDLFATTRSQKYQGFQYRDASGRRLAGESESSRNIVRRTAGLVCTYRGRIFCTYYSAVCGGRTTEGTAVFSDAAPPLKSVPCSWCRDARYYRWSAELPKTEAARLLSEYFQREGRPFGPQLTGIRPTAGGPIAQFEVTDGRNRHTVAGGDLRRIWPQAGLLSANFTVGDGDGRWRFEGRGHGHGVGLCQWGARGQALAGRSVQDILTHYYPGCRLVDTRLAANPPAAQRR